jgi:group II intron reverse transcriptase/maturase
MGMKRVLESVYEVDFLECSYGFRPGRSCHDALGAIQTTIYRKPVNVVIDADIKGFFDEVDHEWLMKFLDHRIADSRLLRYVKRFLKAGVMKEGRRRSSEAGTPQGGILSPLLANVYLHYVLDLWFEKVVKKRLRGYGKLVRYADDFVILLERDDDAHRVYSALEKRLDKFGLEMSQSKSQMIKFGCKEWNRCQREGDKMATFDFLGLTHFGKRGRRGRFQLGRKTARSRLSRAIKRMSIWLKKAVYPNTPQQVVKCMNRKLVGHYRYFGVGGNFKSLQKLWYEAQRLLFKEINRRSQKRSYNWEQFNRFLKYNPLVRPKIYHTYAQLAAR